MLRDTTQRALVEILASNRIPYEHSKAENTLEMRETRSKILFRPVDDYERLRGTNLAWFGLDELTYAPEEAWLRLEGRLRDPKAHQLCGFGVWTPKGYDWVYRRFITTQMPGYGVVRAQPFENRYILSKTANFYEQLKSSYDAKFYEQEALGEYLSQDGRRVYHPFDGQAHVKELTLDPLQPLLWSLDFNVDPMSSVVAQITAGKTIHVLDEIVLRGAQTQDACAEFLKRYPNHRGGLWIYGDSSGNNEHTTGPSDFAVVKEYLHAQSNYAPKYKVLSKNPVVEGRINLMNGKLRTFNGAITLFVDPKCREVIKDFEEVCYKTGEKGVIDKERDRERTHTSDALGYLVWIEYCNTLKCGPRRDGRLCG